MPAVFALHAGLHVHAPVALWPRHVPYGRVRANDQRVHFHTDADGDRHRSVLGDHASISAAHANASVHCRHCAHLGRIVAVLVAFRLVSASGAGQHNGYVGRVLRGTVGRGYATPVRHPDDRVAVCRAVRRDCVLLHERLDTADDAGKTATGQ